MAHHRKETVPVTQYCIRCLTDENNSEYDIQFFEEAKKRIRELREDYPNDKFQLVAFLDA